MGRTHSEEIRGLIERYRSADRPWPAAAHDMALWAIDNKLWAPRFVDFANRLADDMSRAMREEYFTDARGRQVRAKHAARTSNNPKQLPLWDDIRTASQAHMQISFRQRREQIVGDCHQLKIDVDFFNEQRQPATPIQLVLDFTRDVQERELEDEL